MNETDLINFIMEQAEAIIASGRPLSPALMGELTDFFQSEIQREKTTPPNIPPGAENLWELSGGKPEAFASYLGNYPDPTGQLSQLLRNPARLDRVIETLDNENPAGVPPTEDGFQKASPHSSNVYGFNYDPKSKELLVRFNSGSVYHYDDVPNHVFRIFQSGAFPAKTSGRNQYGQWWVGKTPSLGAAFAEYIRNKPYPYQRVS